MWRIHKRNPNANNWYGDVTGTYTYKNTKDAVYAAYGIVNRPGSYGNSTVYSENNSCYLAYIYIDEKYKAANRGALSTVSNYGAAVWNPMHEWKILIQVLRDSSGMTGLSAQCTMTITEDLVL